MRGERIFKRSLHRARAGRLCRALVFTAVVSLSAFLSACTIRPVANHKIRIQFPKEALRENPPVSGRALRTSSPSGISHPSSLAEFTCFGVLVTGYGISDSSPLSCAMESTTSPAAKVVAFAPTEGGQLEILLPRGQKDLTVFAVKSTVGCPNLEELLTQPSDQRFQGMSGFYRIGRATFDLVEDLDVPIKIAYDPASAQRIYEACAGTETPIATRGSGQLRIARASLLSAATASDKPGGCQSTSGRPCFGLNAAIGTAITPAGNTANRRFNLRLEHAELNSLLNSEGK